MNANVLKKLHYKEGPGLVLNAPDGFTHDFSRDYQAGDKFDFVILFVNSAKEVEEWVPKTIPLLNPKALFWVSYPKQSSKIKTDINRDIIWKLLEGISDYRLVSNVAIDDTWSALRCRHRDEVKK